MYTVEEEVQFGMIPRNDHGEYIRVARIKTKTGEAIDIRGMYTSDKDGQIYPTQKGVRIKDEQIVAVLCAVLDAATPEEFNEVMEHFDTEDAVDEG